MHISSHIVSVLTCVITKLPAPNNRTKLYSFV